MQTTRTTTISNRGRDINAQRIIQGGPVNIVRADRRNTVIVAENDDPTITAIFTLLSQTQLNPMREADALAALMREGGYNQTQLKTILGGATQSQICKRLRLRKLIPALQERLRNDTLCVSVARELANLPPTEQEHYINQEHITVAEALTIRRQQYTAGIDLTNAENIGQDTTTTLRRHIANLESIKGYLLTIPTRSDAQLGEYNRWINIIIHHLENNQGNQHTIAADLIGQRQAGMSITPEMPAQQPTDTLHELRQAISGLSRRITPNRQPQENTEEEDDEEDEEHE